MDEAEYAQLIGDRFLEIRGRGFSLSPFDMRLIVEWFEQGVPAFIPMNVMADIEDYMQRSGLKAGTSRGTSRRIRGMAYIQEEVEARFSELLQGHVGCGGCEKAYCIGKAYYGGR